ncbi:Hemicentin-1 [Porites harrisoni]
MATSRRLHSTTFLVIFLVWASVLESWGQRCGKTAYGNAPQVDFFATVHGDSSLSENPHNDILVQKDSNVTLTCTAKGPKEPSVWASSHYYYPYEMNWFVNSTYLEMPICTYKKPSPNKACIRNLGKVQPDDRGRYSCQAVNRGGCTYKELNLIVTGGYSTTTGSKQTSKTPHYETNLVPATSEAPATHVVPPTSVQDQATTVSSVTPIVQAARVFPSTPEDVPARKVSPVKPEAQAKRVDDDDVDTSFSGV